MFMFCHFPGTEHSRQTIPPRNTPICAAFERQHHQSNQPVSHVFRHGLEIVSYPRWPGREKASMARDSVTLNPLGGRS